jgi:formate/nitrite transporter FocA (FNT family)
MSARTVTGKVFAILFPITGFVASGFEHSVANMYFIPEALFIKMWAPSEFWIDLGTSASAFAGLTWHNFFAANLLPVTIGNIIGGSVLVGLVYWFIYLRGPRQTVR